MGYNARMLSREGAIVSALLENESERQLNENVGILENTKVEYKDTDFITFADQNKYDLILVLNFLQKLPENTKKINIIKKIDFYTKEMLIWSSNVNTNKEKKLIMEHSAFKKYESIEIDQNGYELGIFYKSEQK
jgi:hypothetical protein